MKNNISTYDLIIIGSGPAGMAAAIYAARAMINVLIIERYGPGGKLVKTQDIENYPGYDKILGPDLASAMHKQVEIDLKVKTEKVGITKVEVNGNWKVIYDNESKPLWKAKAVIIATGTLERKIGAPGEEELYGKGVSYCAVCDGRFFTDQNIAVVGGGNAAIEEAIYLTKYAKELFIIHRRQGFRANKDFLDRAKKNDKIKWYLDNNVIDILGTEKVEGIKIKNTITNEIQTLDVKAIFPYIGSDPNSYMVKDLSICDENNYIITNEKMETSIAGIYAVGDVRNNVLKQIATSVGDGAIAGQMAAMYIDLNKETWE